MDDLSAGDEMEVVTSEMEQQQLLPSSRTITVTNSGGVVGPLVSRTGPGFSSSTSSQGVPVLQITIVHAGNTHTISKDDQYEYQYKSASGEVSSLPFDNSDDDLIEVSDGNSTFTLKRSMVYDYRKQANYYGALKVFRERTKVRRNGKDEVVIRTSLIQVRVTAKDKDGKKLGPHEIPPSVTNTPGIIPPIDPKEVQSYKPPTSTNMVPITFGNHIVDINKKAIEQFKKMSGVNRALKAQLSKLYKRKNGIDVPITVLKLFASNRKPGASVKNSRSTLPDSVNVVKWPPQATARNKNPAARIPAAIPDDSTSNDIVDLKHYLTTKSTEVNCELSQLGRSWCRYNPRDTSESDFVPEGDFVPPDMNDIIHTDALWNYLINYAKEIENFIDFEYEINEDRWLELKRASNTFHVNGEMWPDVVVKVVYRLNKETKEYEVTYFVRVLGRLIKTGVLMRGVDVNNIVQLLGPDRKICVGVMATPYLQLLDKNTEMCRVLKREGVLVLHPFESLHSEKCCGLVRDVSQTHLNSFRRGSVGVEGEQVVCPPCLSLCARLNQLFSATDYQTKSKQREQSAVVSSSGGSNSGASAPTNSQFIGVGVSAALRGSRVREVLTQSLDDILRSSNSRRALLEEDARLGLPARKKVALEDEEYEDPRPEVVLSQEQFVEMIDIRRPEVGGTKKHLYKSCSYCNYRAKTLLSLFAHMKVHLGVMREVCSKCKANFSDKHALEKHRIETHGQKTPECPVCFVELTNNDQLFDHMNRHRTHPPFICTYCSDSFFTLDAYKKHLKSTHKTKSVTDLQIGCKTCNVHFYTQDHLILHRVNMNHNDIDLFTCKVCGFDFDTAASFRDHIMEHTEEERDAANIAVCPTCFKVFFSSYRLNFHIERSHLMPKSNKDPEQPQQQALLIHQPTNKNTKGPYMRYLKQTEKNICSLCNRRFKTVEILQSHIHFCHKGNKFDFSSKKLELLDKNQDTPAPEYVALPNNAHLADGSSMVIDNNVVHMENGQMVEMSQDIMDGSNMIHVDADMMQVANDLVQVGNSFVSLNTSVMPDNNSTFVTATTASGATAALLKEAFRCDMCGRKFDSEAQLSSHIKIHSGNRSVFQCEECGQIYSKKQQVLDHIRIDHADQVQQHASQVQQQQQQQQDDCAGEIHTSAAEAPLLHFVDQASEQQVEVQTASQDDVMLQLSDF
ncbi:Zinc finger C2H2-type [Trinorchestia longiramus]|nr:Zinc finger C2H2-type [Trinorchestia longiramus]